MATLPEAVDYPALLNRLLQLQRSKGMMLGLEQMRMLDLALGEPSKRFPSVHIGGTNGKGSVSWKLAHALMRSGYKVGLFTSPHISTFRERILLNGKMVSQAFLEQELPRLFSLCEEKGITPTFFELTTALAFLAFAKEQVDIAVVEVGLGGRLDATNIISPLLTCITSISKDHCDWLGHSLEEIATEKGGIIKQGVSLVAPSGLPLVLRQMANEKNAPYCEVQSKASSANAQNSLLAAELARKLVNCGFSCSEKALSGLEQVRPPCRFEQLSVERAGKKTEVVIDVAHNPASFEELMRQLGEKEKALFVVALSKDKDIKGCLQSLKDRATGVVFATGDHPRLATPEELAQTALEIGFKEEQLHTGGQIQNALKLSCKLQTNERIVVCGSFFVLSAARAWLGIQEEHDPHYLG